MIKTFTKLFENEKITKEIDSERIPEPEKEQVKNIKNTEKIQKTENTKEEIKEIDESVKSFNDFITEGDGGGVAYATAGNSGGMGAIVAPQPSAIPGDVAGSTIGSGDRAAYDMGTHFGFNKNDNPLKKKKKKKKSKKSIKSRHMNTESSKEDMYITSYTDWLNNGF